jgi:hypothetical protein
VILYDTTRHLLLLRPRSANKLNYTIVSSSLYFAPYSGQYSTDGPNLEGRIVLTRYTLRDGPNLAYKSTG